MPIWDHYGPGTASRHFRPKRRRHSGSKDGLSMAKTACGSVVRSGQCVRHHVANPRYWKAAEHRRRHLHRRRHVVSFAIGVVVSRLQDSVKKGLAPCLTRGSSCPCVVGHFVSLGDHCFNPIVVEHIAHLGGVLPPVPTGQVEPGRDARSSSDGV